MSGSCTGISAGTLSDLGVECHVMNTWSQILSFIALFLTTLGIALIFGPVGNDGRPIVGSFFAALGLTFLLAWYLSSRPRDLN
jgi:hypothetical protein